MGVGEIVNIIMDKGIKNLQSDSWFIRFLLLSIVFIGLVVEIMMIGSTQMQPINKNQSDELFTQYEGRVIPENGIVLPIRWGDWLPKTVSSGIIDVSKFEKSFASSGGLSGEERELLSEESDEFIKVDRNNSWFLVTVFWPLGLANKTEFNKQSLIAGDKLYNLASTGGWTLGKAKNGGEYFNKYNLVNLNSEQEELVKELASNFYRPCCNNSTFYQDCNHGSALLGLLELGASQGLSREELARAALAVNSYWFPEQYITMAVYLEKVRGIKWEEADAEFLLGKDFSSLSGLSNIRKELANRSLLPQQRGGSQCGV